MENKNKIMTGIIAVLAVSLSFLGGISLNDDDVYYCEDRSIVMQCDKLSRYYGLDNGKCYNDVVGNKLCRSGWLEIVSGDVITPDPIDEVKINDVREGIYVCQTPDKGGCSI